MAVTERHLDSGRPINSSKLSTRASRHDASAMTLRVAGLFVSALAGAASLGAQARGTAVPPSAAGRAAAPIDLTGYWVSVVTEDWLYRMVTPAKGDYTSVPLNESGKKAADAWDPLSDEKGGNQ